MSDTLYEYYNTGDDNNYTYYGTVWGGQTFTIGTVGTNENFNITSIKLKLFRYGSPGIITVSIKAVDVDGKPTGSDLTSGTTNGNTLPTGSPYEWREVTLTPYTLLANTKYAIVARALSGNPNNSFKIRHDISSPTYTGGSLAYSSDSGSTWSLYTTTDLMFEVYGIATGGGETEYHTPSDTAKASDSPVFKPEIHLSDTAKASDELKTIIDKVLSDNAKASDVISFIKESYKDLSDTAKASDTPAFKPLIQLSDTAKASDSIEFLKARVHTTGDTAKASDELKTIIDKVLSDNAKASDVISFIKTCYRAFNDTAKASDSVSYSFFVSIETPTENINIYR